MPILRLASLPTIVRSLSQGNRCRLHPDRRLRGLQLALCSIALSFSPSVVAQEPQYEDALFRVRDIQVRLMYEQSGALSPDITDNPEFEAFNTSIGEGSATENANDILITAVVQGPGQQNMTTPLLITARGQDGTILASRRIDAFLAEPQTYRSLALYDVGCAGVISITAQLGTSSRVEDISLHCGE